jgi:hypothetical protein
LRSPGRPLDPATREFFEPRFSHDFAKVRVHADPEAARSARALSARAYVVGREMVFGAGQFSPATRAGRRLLAHELVHTIQQGDRSAALPDRLPLALPGDAHEQEAERISSDVLGDAGVPVGVRGIRPDLAVARSPDSVAEATEADRATMVMEAARFLRAMADHVHTKRQAAAVALATTPGSAAGPRAFHRHLNQAQIESLLAKTISVFDAQKSDNPLVNFPDESPEQTRLGEAYARAMEQLGLAIGRRASTRRTSRPTCSRRRTRDSRRIRCVGFPPTRRRPSRQASGEHSRRPRPPSRRASMAVYPPSWRIS